MKNAIDKVVEFHRGCDIPIMMTGLTNRAQLPSKDIRDRRIKLIAEEYIEYLKAEMANDVVLVADALGDLVYVIIGATLEYGIDLHAVFNEIHRSNMTKIKSNGEVIRREDGKILKPDTYEPPRIAEVLGLK